MISFYFLIKQFWEGGEGAQPGVIFHCLPASKPSLKNII